jgi:hypothetical protein
MLNVETMLETALWATIGDDDKMLDEDYSIDDVPQELKDEDFWLTVHGHGAGFWDGDYERGDELTELCKQFKTFEDDLRDNLTN